MESELTERGTEAAFPDSVRSGRSDAIRRGMRLRMAEGMRPGPAPLGYAIRMDGERAVRVLDPEKAPLIREAFAMAASGVPLRASAKALWEKGLTGGRGGSVSVSTLARALRDPAYAAGAEPAVGRREFAAAQAALWERRR